jgi:membrane fusion protein, copper/silver efflux system
MKTFSLSVVGQLPARACIVLLWFALLPACQREAAAPAVADKPTASSVKPAATIERYVCPMHPHIRQHGPGVCPICGMTLEKKLIPVESATPQPGGEVNSAAGTPAANSDQRVLYYYDPMRPEVHFDKPGPSPFMDMALVPKLAAAAADNGSIAVDASVVQSLGIRTAHPRLTDVRPSVRVPARVVADARGQARLQARVSGWIERLAVRTVGQSVSAGSVVAEIYSPELVQAQEELLLGAETVGPATERLRRLGIADSDIQAIRRAGKASRRLPLRAPVSGVVTELGVREGSSLSPDTLIADFSARSSVWIEAALFPSQRATLGDRLSASFTLPGLAGRHWQSDVGAVVPVVDAVTQTLAVRFAISDAADLPLGSALDAVINGQARTRVLVVPVSTVIRTAQGDRVLVRRDPNRFLPVAVTIGQRYGDDMEIVAGLTTKDSVVVSGQFLLDAEANLQSGLGQLDPAAAPAMAGSSP